MKPATVALVQGVYFFITGVWPLVSIRTFMLVTGPKKDIWLVRTVGAVLAVIGLAIGLAGLRGAVPVEIVLLAIGSASVLTAIDTGYSLLRIISKIYLADAVAEMVLIAWWVAALLH